MARARARKTRVQTAPTGAEALPPGATDIDDEEYESAAHATGAYRAAGRGGPESAAGPHHVENGERPKPPAEGAPRAGGHAAAVGRMTPKRAPDPFGFESREAGGNRVRLLKSEREGAWVIRFAHNPNLDKGPDGEEYTKENPHPVLKMLKAEGFRWGFDGGDDVGGWGKKFAGDAFGADHIEARRVMREAADMIGCKMDHGRIPD